jgi:hypothetical protein
MFLLPSKMMAKERRKRKAALIMILQNSSLPLGGVGGW